jgi:hypothetical protein
MKDSLMDENKRKPMQSLLAGGMASYGLLVCAFPVLFLFIAFGISGYLEGYRTQSFFAEYQKKINRISDNKITAYDISSGGDWDPFWVDLTVKTKNRYEVSIALLGGDRSLPFFHSIINLNTKKQYNSDSFKKDYGWHSETAASLDDFIINSDKIVPRMIGEENAAKAP